MMNGQFNDLVDKIFFEFKNMYGSKICSDYLSCNTGILLSFEKYIETLSIDKIQTFDPSFSEKDLSDFRRFIQRGIEQYLVENIKTIALM